MTTTFIHYHYKKFSVPNAVWQMLIFTMIISVPVGVHAAKVYDGYLIKLDSTRVTGRIEMLSPSQNEVKVKMLDENNKATIYKAKDVLEYGFTVEKWIRKEKRYERQNIVYVRQEVKRPPVPFGPKTVLLECEVRGEISMFHHFIEQNSNIQEPYLHIIYLQKADEKGLKELNKTNYKKLLKSMTADCPYLKDKIGRKGYLFRNVPKILKEYNTWKLENQEEVVTERR